jgi:hypothetical protein
MWNTITIERGYWRSDNTSLVFYKCVNAAQCPGGITSCATNREGPLCANCIIGYVPSTLDGTCSACPSNSQSAGMFIVLLLLLLLSLSLSLFSLSLSLISHISYFIMESAISNCPKYYY